jgi:hypothetical protein
MNMHIMGNDIYIFLTKLEKKIELIFFVMGCNFVMTCREKNTIHDSMIQKHFDDMAFNSMS